MSWLFSSGGQSIGASASASVLSINIQGWFPLGWTGFLSFVSKGLSRVFSSTTVWKLQFFSIQPFFMVQLSHLYMTTGKTIALTIWIIYLINNIFEKCSLNWANQVSHPAWDFWIILGWMCPFSVCVYPRCSFGYMTWGLSQSFAEWLRAFH